MATTVGVVVMTGVARSDRRFVTVEIKKCEHDHHGANSGDDRSWETSSCKIDDAISYSQLATVMESVPECHKHVPASWLSSSLDRALPR